MKSNSGFRVEGLGGVNCQCQKYAGQSGGPLVLVYLCGMTLIAPHFHKAKKKAWFRFFRRDHHFVRTPGWLKQLFPGCVWDIPEKEKTLYLTFDDGPHPVITPQLLDWLKQYNAKATFFCIGDNVLRYPDVYRRLLTEGHTVGNHTHQHVNGWKTGTAEYLANVDRAARHIQSDLFRPPYGRITRRQLKGLRSRERNMQVIMWNILAGDWVEDLSPESCFRRVSQRIRGGEIIVFHDSEKAWPRVAYAIPKLLEEFTASGFRFEAIPVREGRHA